MPTRVGRVLLRGTVCLGALALTLYMAARGNQLYTARQADSILSRLEKLKVGDPVRGFQQAVSPCEVGTYTKDSTYTCHLVAGPYRLSWLWQKIFDSPRGHGYWIYLAANRIGLRAWMLSSVAHTSDGKITAIRTDVWVPGRYEMLGATWRIGEAQAQQDLWRLLDTDDQRTYMNWYHITSDINGEGFAVKTTPQSTDEELAARHINAACLSSVSGCEGLCELMPRVVPILEKRGRGIGGCAWGVPLPKCHSKYDQPCPDH